MTQARPAFHLSDMRDLPALSQVVIDLQASLTRDDVALNDIADDISRDQALSAKALRLANCSLFGVAGRVVTIRDAVGFLGLRSVSTLLTAAAVSNCFPRVESRAFDIRQYWRHSLGTALCAREIAAAVNVSRDLAFTGGLLHDLGRLALASRASKTFDEVAELRASEDGLMLDAEHQLLGTDHAEIGASMALRWHFAEPVVDAIRLHHRPPPARQSSLVDVVHAADCVVHALDVAGDQSEIVPPLDVDAWNRLALTPPQCRVIFERTETELGELCDALSV